MNQQLKLSLGGRTKEPQGGRGCWHTQVTVKFQLISKNRFKEKTDFIHILNNL